MIVSSCRWLGALPCFLSAALAVAPPIKLLPSFPSFATQPPHMRNFDRAATASGRPLRHSPSIFNRNG